MITIYSGVDNWVSVDSGDYSDFYFIFSRDNDCEVISIFETVKNCGHIFFDGVVPGGLWKLEIYGGYETTPDIDRTLLFSDSAVVINRSSRCDTTSILLDEGGFNILDESLDNILT